MSTKCSRSPAPTETTASLRNTTPIKGEPTGVVVGVSFNPGGEAQHLVVSHRPRSSMLLFSRLMGEKFVHTAIGEHFITSEPETGVPRTAGTASAV